MSGWKGLEKTLKNDKYFTRVGILGSEASKQHDGTKKTNAEIGAIHELGLVAGIPQRSFLKMPLELKLFEKIKSEKDNFYAALKSGKIVNWFAAVGWWCEEIIHNAFESSGFGSWEANAESTLKRKAPETKPLIHTRQLKNSISSVVIEK